MFTGSSLVGSTCKTPILPSVREPRQISYFCLCPSALPALTFTKWFPLPASPLATIQSHVFQRNHCLLLPFYNPYIFKQYTGIEMKPEPLKVLKYTMLARILGFTFAVKLMENGEENAQEEYELLKNEVQESIWIRQQEEEHETALLGMLDEERLRYVGSMVLGLNDALVELTGSLAGFTFALQDTRLISLSGLIIGISATFSMASSEFLAARSVGRNDDRVTR